MSLVTRRLRSLLIALAVLALSATAVFAGHSALSAPSGQVASQGQGDGDQADENEAPETDEDADADEDADEAPEAAEAPETDEAAGGVHPDNHGKLVSEAAQGATPADAANHGAYVRTIARDNHGQDEATKHAPKNTQH